MTEREQIDFKAHARVRDAKRKMDDAQAALEVAEAEWLSACSALDQLQGLELPTAADVRGILRTQNDMLIARIKGAPASPGTCRKRMPTRAIRTPVLPDHQGPAMKRTIEDIRANLDHVGCDNDTAREMTNEIERLRAALREIAEMPPLRSFNSDGSPAVYDAEQQLARAALGDEQSRADG